MQSNVVDTAFSEMLEQWATNDAQDFAQFMEVRNIAANAFVNGEAEPVTNLLTRVPPATFFGPKGDCIQGPDQLLSTFKRDSSLFESGDSSFEILHLGASDGLAYWVGLQRATARLAGRAENLPFNLRVTEIFRKEGEEWKLIHRHADPLKPQAE
jgi:Domain of unknown function (DUF4440)